MSGNTCPNGDQIPKIGTGRYDFEWSRDVDGYFVEDLGDLPNGGLRLQVSGISGKTERVRPMEDPLLFTKLIKDVYRRGGGATEAVLWVDCNQGTEKRGKTDILVDHEGLFAGAVEFANKFGLLYHSGNDVFGWYIFSALVARLEKLYLSGHQYDAVREFNESFDLHHQERSFKATALLIPKLGMIAATGKMGLVFQPANLMAAIASQIASYITGERTYRLCAWCQAPFSYGPGTGHKSNKRTCSDRCKVAHWRANRKGVSDGED